MKLLANKIFNLSLLILLVNSAFAQQQVAFDIKTTSLNKFDSPKKMSEAFLQYFLSPDSTNYSAFYCKEIMCLLIQEEINKQVSSQKITSSEELCADSIIKKVFQLTATRKRRDFVRLEGDMNFTTIDITGFNSLKKKTESLSNYKFDLYDLRVHFKNQKTGKAYRLDLFDVYHVNYKWFILDPGFEILSE